MANIGLTKDTADGMVRSGVVDLTSLGRSFISNLDLVERFQNGWTLNPDATYDHWWKSTGAVGDTDFPFFQEEKEEKKEELRNNLICSGNEVRSNFLL
jgi:N-ethylmaleimide reductase